ncbi:MAG: sigma-70 family RNA polymerase sigma factor [Planctomycetes bacterium]|nr:sigma-70 family RNA polymerase sigma factor [Planctomycetota bacterium]
MRRSDDTQMMGDQIRFPTTSWTLVRSSANLKALESIINLYWKPLYFFVRQHGYANEAAKDIVQEFLKTMIERGSLHRADPARGRFRTFLLAALSNFLKDWIKAESRRKRGGEQQLYSLDFAQGESEYLLQVSGGETPEAVLNRAWARSLWNHSIEELQGGPVHLEAFRLYLADAGYDVICRRTGLSESAAKTAIHRLKAQLKQIVTNRIRETAANEDDLQKELAEFLELLG